MPREPASTASEARRAKAQAARRERRPWMADANVRRRGTVNPEPGAGQGSANPRGPRACGWSIGRGGKSLVAPHRFRTAKRAVQGGRRDRGLLERSPTPASSCADQKEPAEQRFAILRGVGRATGDGLDGQRSPEGESAGGAERAEAMDGRRERPATWCGQSRAPRDPEHRQQHPPLKQPCVTETTAAASCSPSADREDRTETSCPCPHVRPHGSGTETAL